MEFLTSPDGNQIGQKTDALTADEVFNQVCLACCFRSVITKD